MRDASFSVDFRLKTGDPPWVLSPYIPNCVGWACLALLSWVFPSKIVLLVQVNYSCSLVCTRVPVNYSFTRLSVVKHWDLDLHCPFSHVSRHLFFNVVIPCVFDLFSSVCVSMNGVPVALSVPNQEPHFKDLNQFKGCQPFIPPDCIIMQV